MVLSKHNYDTFYDFLTVKRLSNYFTKHLSIEYCIQTYIRGVIKKIIVIIKFRELRMFNFRIFFCYVGTHVCYTICWQFQPFWIVSLFLTDNVFLVCSSIFYNSKKWIKFCVKNEIKCARTFELLTVRFSESTMSRTQVQLW